MLDILPNDIIIIVLSKLSNFNIINSLLISKHIRSIIKSDFFIKYLLRRHHPMVFNSMDLYCNICNIHIYRINDKNKKFMKCKH